MLCARLECPLPSENKPNPVIGNHVPNKKNTAAGTSNVIIEAKVVIDLLVPHASGLFERTLIELFD